MFKRAIVFGGSRGLGRALVETLPSRFPSLKEIVCVSRKGVIPLDLAHPEGQTKACDLVKTFDLVIYVAGGGPHGVYTKKDWKDHEWAIEVNFIAPMKLIHSWLKSRMAEDGPGGFVVIGSAVAEDRPDPLAASYSGSKCGLWGFVRSLQEEIKGQSNKVWLFSPGYMDTEMLALSPANKAKMKAQGIKIHSPKSVAEDLLTWLSGDGPWHKKLH